MAEVGRVCDAFDLHPSLDLCSELFALLDARLQMFNSCLQPLQVVVFARPPSKGRDWLKEHDQANPMLNGKFLHALLFEGPASLQLAI